MRRQMNLHAIMLAFASSLYLHLYTNYLNYCNGLQLVRCCATRPHCRSRLCDVPVLKQLHDFHPRGAEAVTDRGIFHCDWSKVLIGQIYVTVFLEKPLSIAVPSGVG